MKTQEATPLTGALSPEGATNVPNSVANVASRLEGLMDDNGFFGPNPSKESGQQSQSDESKPDVSHETKAQGAKGEEVSDEKTSAEESEQETEEKAEQKEAEALSTIDQLCEATGLSTNDVLALKVSTKIDGQSGEATIGQLLKSYQLEGHLNQKSMRLAEKEKAADTELEKLKADLVQKIQQSDLLSTHLENDLKTQYQKINWDELRGSNPAEYAAKRQEFSERWQQIQNFKTQSLQTLQQVQEEHVKKQQTQYQEILKQEQSKMLDAIPEWKDTSKAEKEMAQMRDYLRSSYGFADDQLNTIDDYRQVLLIRKAMLYDQASNKADVAKKKIVNLPKLLKPGVRQSESELRAEAREKKLSKLKKSGKTEDVVPILLDMIN